MPDFGDLRLGKSRSEEGGLAVLLRLRTLGDLTMRDYARYSRKQPDLLNSRSRAGS